MLLLFNSYLTTQVPNATKYLTVGINVGEIFRLKIKNLQSKFVVLLNDEVLVVFESMGGVLEIKFTKFEVSGTMEAFFAGFLPYGTYAYDTKRQQQQA